MLEGQLTVLGLSLRFVSITNPSIRSIIGGITSTDFIVI